MIHDVFEHVEEFVCSIYVNSEIFHGTKLQMDPGCGVLHAIVHEQDLAVKRISYSRSVTSRMERAAPRMQASPQHCECGVV